MLNGTQISIIRFQYYWATETHHSPYTIDSSLLPLLLVAMLHVKLL